MGKIKKMTMKKRKLIVIVLISSLAVILGVAGWWYFVQNTAVTDRSAREVTEMSDVSSITAEGRRLLAEKDIKGGEAKFDTALQSTKDADVELQLLLSKINFYIEANEIDKAIATAKDTDKRFPGKVAVYAALATAYELKGANAEAIAEYQRALTVLGDETNTDTSQPAASRSNPRTYYEARIKELQ